jgi:LysM repeat protein
MKTKLRTLATLFYLLASQSIFAETYLLDAKSECLDRMEYGFSNTRAGEEFIYYALKIDESQKLVMSVGIENALQPRAGAPGATTACFILRNKPLQNWLDQINNGNLELFIVSNLGNNLFRTARVNSAYLYTNSASELGIRSFSYSFSYRHSLGYEPNSDLATNGAGGSIKLFGKQFYKDCAGYVFQRENRNTRETLNMWIIPKIGIVEEGKEGATSTLKLRKVNGQSLDYILDKACGGNPSAFNKPAPTLEEAPREYSYIIGAFYPDKPAEPNTLTPKGAPNLLPQPSKSFANPTQGPPIHTVAKGETLYAIARKYNLSVDDLKKWNRLGSSELRVGAVLRLGPDSGTSTDKGKLATSNPNLLPQPITDNRGPQTTPYWVNNQGFYQFGANDNFAQVAKLYGYTEERLRYMNNLTPGELPRPGQYLRVSDCDAGNSSNVQPSNVPPPYNYPGQPSNVPRSYDANSPIPPPRGGSIPQSYNQTGKKEDPWDYENRDPKTTPRRQDVPQSYDAPFTAKGRKIHVVQPGETLEEIADFYGIDPGRLRQINNMDMRAFVTTNQQVVIE